jgi:hypothetical protein
MNPPCTFPELVPAEALIRRMHEILDRYIDPPIGTTPDAFLNFPEPPRIAP